MTELATGGPVWKRLSARASAGSRFSLLTLKEAGPARQSAEAAEVPRSAPDLAPPEVKGEFQAGPGLCGS